MSLLKAIKAQLGLSNTAAENHFFDGSTANQLKLTKGTPSSPGVDVMTVDATGKVAFPQNAQTLTDVRVTPGRVTGTTYTNGTGQTITVMVTVSSTAAPCAVQATIDGLLFNGSTVTVIGYYSQIIFVVPAGKNYSVNVTAGTPTVQQWLELR